VKGDFLFMHRTTTSRHAGTNVSAFGWPSPRDRTKEKRKEKRVSAAAHFATTIPHLEEGDKSSGFGMAPIIMFKLTTLTIIIIRMRVYPSDFYASVSAAAFGGCCS
jgi:hypothetical protein